MQDLYIQLVNNQPVNYPLLGDNLREVLQVQELTKEILEQAGYAKYERTNVLGYSVVSEHGYKLHEDGIVRDILTLEAWTQEHKLDIWVRDPRNHCLYGCDWTQIPGNALTAEKKAEWATYRQQLRELPQIYANIQNPNELVPPTPPTK